MPSITAHATQVKRRPKTREATLLAPKAPRSRAHAWDGKTIPLEKAHALRFAAALAASPHIALAVVKRDHRATSPANWSVWFIRQEGPSPSADTRFDDVRAQRACEEAAEMVFLPTSESGVYRCLHIYPDREGYGEYRVSLTSCTCPDYDFRARHAQTTCKHPRALSLHLNLPPAILQGQAARRTDETPEQLRARMLRQRALDFGG